MTTPEAGTSVLALFPGTTGLTYHAGTGEPGGPIGMLPVFLPGGHRVDIPDVEGVAILPHMWATMLADAVLETVRLWEPGPDVPACPDCSAAGPLMCSAHQEDQARSDQYRRLLGWLVDMGIEPSGANPEAAGA